MAKSHKGPHDDPERRLPRTGFHTGRAPPPPSGDASAPAPVGNAPLSYGQILPHTPLPETATFLGTAQALWGGDNLRALLTRANRILSEQLASPYPRDRARSGITDEYLLDSAQRILNRLSGPIPAKGAQLSLTEQIAILRVAIAVREHELGIKDPPRLPETAPTYWADRNPEGDMNPAEFARAIYGRWIGNGLTRQHLRKLDYPLYRALSVWESRHPGDRIAELLTISEVIDSKIAALSKELDPDELRKLASTLQNRHRKSKT